MELIQTPRICIRATYDLLEKRVKGEVYSKIEGEAEVHVGTVLEEPKGASQLSILSEYRDKDYIVEDYEELKGQIADYANMWTARASRGIC